MQFRLSIKLFFLLTTITALVMSAFIGLRYYMVSSQLKLELEGRAEEAALRVAESVSPSIWNIHQKLADGHYSSEVALAILDAEMASELVTAISIYGNFGHLYLGRYKQLDGQLVSIDDKLDSRLADLRHYRIRQPIKSGSMTIGAVEVIYSIDSIESAINSGLLLELLQVAVVSMLVIGLLYWSLRQSLLLPIQSLQVARQSLNALSEGVILTNSDFNVIDMNAAYEEMTGYRKDELMGRRPMIKLMERSVDKTVWQQLRSGPQWSGEVVVRRKGKLSFPAKLNFNEVWHGGKLVCHVGIITNISMQKESENQLQRMAYFDSLTSLPNRPHFIKTLEHEIQVARRQDRSMGLLFIDLDNFKWINDHHGHAMGDKYLENVAGRLRKRVRNTDFIFRLGGDEFTTIATDICDEASLSILARDLIAVAAETIKLDGHKLSCGASIGIALYPRDADNAEQLIQRADTAMYQAKQDGGDQLVFFSSELENTRRSNRETDEALRQALPKNELMIYFQPKVHYVTSPPNGNVGGRDIASSRVQGAEALLRWFRPGYSILNPKDFIPIAEQSDLIVDIGHWVIRAACQQLARWKKTSLGALTIAVNLSPRQLRHDDFVGRLADTILEFGVNPAQLELEVTESAVIENIDQSVDTLNQLKRLGVTIAMDDFGTGFSSLSYLKQLPIDVIKIDRSFINDLPNDDDDVVIVNAIFSMARAMNIKVVAEGIENYAQLQFLLGQGCQCSQGFFHSRPLPAADFERWVGLFNMRIEKALSDSDSGPFHGRVGISPALTGGS